MKTRQKKERKKNKIKKGVNIENKENINEEK